MTKHNRLESPKIDRSWMAADNVALVIVDMQNDFMPGGRLSVERGDEIVPLINQLRDNFKTIIMTQDWHPPGHISFAGSHENKDPFDTIKVSYGDQVLWPEHCVQGSRGAQFHPGLKRKKSDLLIRKGTNPQIDSYSAFFENDGKTRPRFSYGDTFVQRIQKLGIDTLVFVGLAGDYCVAWNALDAKKAAADLTSVFVEDLTRAISQATLQEKKQMMRKSGVIITGSDQLRSVLPLVENSSNKPKLA